MANRLKEQEKNEKIIRGLTKLSENRKCINCGSLGPQYVCTNFAIFICTTCSGMHREFTHRVKSISMATFTPAEVAALQAGGNQRARDIYFKDWDSTRQSLPDASNPDKLRDFIRTVYVDRRFSGERKARLSDAEDGYDSRNKPDRFKHAQSPAYEERDDRRYYNRPGSRGSDRGFDEKMSPARFDERERYDSRGYQNDRDRDRRYDDRDRRFDDRERRYDERDRYYEDRDRHYDDKDRRNEDRDRRNGERDRRPEVEEQQRRWEEPPRVGNRRLSDDLDKRPSRPSAYRGGETPPLRSVRDILGEDVPKLRVEDGARGNGRVAEDAESPRSVSSSQGEIRLRPSTSLDRTTNGTVKAVAAVPQPAISESLIDFSADPEPPKPAAAAAASVATTTPFDPFGTAEPAKESVPFDPFASADSKVPFGPSKTTATTATFDPFAMSEPTSGWASFDTPPKPAPAPTLTPAESFFQQPVSDPTHGKPNGLQTDWTVQQQPSAPNGWPPHPAQSMQEPWNSIPQQRPAQNFMQQQQQPPVLPQQQQQQPPVLPQQQQQQVPVDNGSQLLQRREIPENLFFAPAPQYNGPMQMHMRPGFGFPQPGYMHIPGPMPSYVQPMNNKSNPFDDANSTFPSMTSLQSALPAFTPGGPLSSPAPALGGPPPQWSQSGFGGPPASFPPASYGPPSAMQGGGFNQQQQMHQPQMMPHFQQGGGFGNPGYANGPPSFSANAMQPAAGNPFG